MKSNSIWIADISGRYNILFQMCSVYNINFTNYLKFLIFYSLFLNGRRFTDLPDNEINYLQGILFDKINFKYEFLQNNYPIAKWLYQHLVDLPLFDDYSHYDVYLINGTLYIETP